VTSDVENVFRTAIQPEDMAEFCRRNHIRRLALFGSILTERFRPESDVDVLVEFESGKSPGFFGVVRMESELSRRIGRRVDLRTPGGLSDYFRGDVLAEAAVQYERT
jgi:predicted nucleotidyltransferase